MAAYHLSEPKAGAVPPNLPVLVLDSQLPSDEVGKKEKVNYLPFFFTLVRSLTCRKQEKEKESDSGTEGAAGSASNVSRVQYARYE